MNTLRNKELYNLDNFLIREEIDLPNGWIKEVYLDRDGNLSVSSALTSNSWTNETDKIGTIESLSISDLEGFYKIDDDFVEVDDMLNETDEGFKDSDYERYYEDSSIITFDETIERIAENADVDDWFRDIKDEIQKRGLEEFYGVVEK